MHESQPSLSFQQLPRALSLLAFMAACVHCGRPPAQSPLLELLPPDKTGVAFVNALNDDTTFNLLNYLYYYNGGGVAVGDVDNDGLPDLYFTSNLGANRLYRNKGNYQFEDITERAGVADSVGWKTGVTMADVNGDGHVDIYVSAVNYLTMKGRNALYINEGDGTFTDRTKEFGLDFEGYSTQALFFDYDGDGDLDMYLLNNSTHADQQAGVRDRRVRHARAGDRLYRNDGGHFTDVSERAGIYGGVEGFGLGVVASDLNGDGCPDLYVTNDFQENDFLYFNNCHGTFTESIARATGHTSQFSMGVDAADFNNDGRPDVITVDMLPEREDILKTSASAESFALYNLKLEAGYHSQFARNALQLNRGNPTSANVTRAKRSSGGAGAPLALFSDIGFLAGVFATDWSWAPLFADLDNDGLKDLFVTNGIYRRPNDLDYINYISGDAVQASLARDPGKESPMLLKLMPHVSMSNYAFHNDGGLRFSDLSRSWGLGEAGFSNGAVYVDLNNSGALDLVVNKINAPAAIYRNHARETNGRHFLRVDLRGAGKNTQGIGAKVIIRQGATTQMLEQMPTRGFQSSVDPRLHFGLGTSTRVDSLTVIWPDQRLQILTDVPVDQALTLSQKDAAGRYTHSPPRQRAELFADVTAQVGIDFKHNENVFWDFNREPLMPHLLSTEGPALAVGDVNGDGLDDFYVGGAKWQGGQLFVQRPDGRFHPSKQAAFQADSLAEDVDAVFFDANGDGFPDLYVVSGGNEFEKEDEPLQDRLYLNDGKGNFHRDRTALPRVAESGSCVVVGDFDGDGHLDLFVGRRVVSRRYGLSPRSYLLQNDGQGHFRDVTREKSEALSEVGMVSSAVWIDYDSDGKLDLVVVGEWMPVRVFHQENGRFVDRTAQAGLSGTNGWWNTVSAVDADGDGKPDLVLGNLGLNSYIRASQREPARLHIHDFAKNGTLQQILTSYRNGVSYPFAGRDEIVRQIPSLRSRYPSYKDFGASRLEEIFPASDLTQAKVLEADTFASAVAVNKGDGTFRMRPLPAEAQFAPIYSALAGDFDGDGTTDLLVAGNFYGVTPMRGRYDASYGLFLRGTNTGAFTPVDMGDSNLDIEGQVRRTRFLRTARGRLIVIARNNDKLLVLRPAH